MSWKKLLKEAGHAAAAPSQPLAVVPAEPAVAAQPGPPAAVSSTTLALGFVCLSIDLGVIVCCSGLHLRLDA